MKTYIYLCALTLLGASVEVEAMHHLEHLRRRLCPIMHPATHRIVAEATTRSYSTSEKKKDNGDDIDDVATAAAVAYINQTASNDSSSSTATDARDSDH